MPTSMDSKGMMEMDEKLSTEHDKRREYWLTIGEYLTISGHPVHNELDAIHVREVRPQERTIFPDHIAALGRILNAFDTVTDESPQMYQGQDDDMIKLRGLLPEGTEVAK